MNFFASAQKSEGRETLENMEGEEERGIVGEENSQKDAAADETSRQKERSQTPQLGSDRGSDDDDDKEDEREEQTSGSLWGHTRLPPSVYGNNPPSGGKRMGKANAVWEVVKHLKERTTDGVVVDAKYSHVCISPINAAEAGEQGPDVDSHGNSLWFCNKQLRQDYLWVIDSSQLSTNVGPRPTRVKVFKRDMSDRAIEMWRKSELEMERRWCTNVTEEINHSALVHTDHDLLVSVLDLRTVTCPHIDSTYEIPRLRKVLMVAYVKYGLNEFDLEQEARQQAIDVDILESSLAPKKKKAKGKEDRIALHVEDQQALVMGLGTRDCVAGCGWGASSDEEEVVVLTVEDRELREKALEAECAVALKRWVTYGRDLDFTPYLKERVTKPAADKAPDIVVLDADVSAVEQKNYDLMGDLLEADILMLFRQVLREEETLVKVGGQAQFGYLPRMALANIGAMNAESFCERILSCASLVVTDLHTSLDHEEVRMLTMLRMNKSLMEYMRKEYDNLHSHIEASETRITKQLRDKAEVQAQEAAAMDEEY